MSIWLILALILAGLEALAVHKGWHRLEYVAKPAVIVVLMIWVTLATGLQGHMIWFGIGLLFALLGDILLMVPGERLFIPGLVAFFVTHVCYILGFQEQLLHLNGWSFVLLFFILLNGIRLLRRIAGAMRARGQDSLVNPVILYGLVISLMLYAAMSTIFDPAWTTGASFFVSVGALLFWISDLMMAWNKFVSPAENRRVPSIVAYQLGQILLITGLISQFTHLSL